MPDGWDNRPPAESFNVEVLRIFSHCIGDLQGLSQSVSASIRLLAIDVKIICKSFDTPHSVTEGPERIVSTLTSLKYCSLIQDLWMINLKPWARFYDDLAHICPESLRGLVLDFDVPRPPTPSDMQKIALHLSHLEKLTLKCHKWPRQGDALSLAFVPCFIHLTSLTINGYEEVFDLPVLERPLLKYLHLENYYGSLEALKHQSQLSSLEIRLVERPKHVMDLSHLPATVQYIAIDVDRDGPMRKDAYHNSWELRGPVPKGLVAFLVRPALPGAEMKPFRGQGFIFTGRA